MVGWTEDDWQARRYQTMSLQTLPNLKREKLRALNFGRPTNYVDDIQGSKHVVRWEKYTTKPNFLDNSDIQGSRSMVLHPRLTNKVDRQLYLDDIEGSRPRPKEFRTRRNTNPLVPDYKLPTVTLAPPMVPKFIRDNVDISDIEGARPNRLYPWQMRESMVTCDVEGAHADWRPRHERARREAPPHDVMKVQDVLGDGLFRSSRCTDPLQPVYNVNGVHIVDDPIHSRPKRLPKKKNCPYYCLVTQDIEGAKPGWRPPTDMRPQAEERRHWRNTNFVGDIVGAQANSLTHAIRTERHVNPLNPTYISLDGVPLANPVTPLYKDPATIEAEMAAHVAMERAAAQAMNNNNNQANDKRDRLIEKLEEHVARLQQEVEGSNNPSSAPPSNIANNLEFVPPQRSSQISTPPPFITDASQEAPTASASGGIFLRTESCAGVAQGGLSSSERLVLVSPNGRPRVSLTPSEVKAAQVTPQDIQAVRDLPSYHA